jgi:hypothetical protein
MTIHNAEDRDRTRSLLSSRLALAYQAKRVAKGSDDRPAGNRADAEIDCLLGLWSALLSDTAPVKR